MDFAYLRCIGLDIEEGVEGSRVVDQAANCLVDQADANADARVSLPLNGSKVRAKPPEQVSGQSVKDAPKQADDQAAKTARAAAKAAKQREKDVSQTLSMLLRHRAREVGVFIDGAGWVTVQDALSWMNSFQGDDAIDGPPVSEEEVRAVVSASDKQRFDLWEGPQQLRIRASQGHSMPGIDLDLEPLTSADAPLAVHGTYYAAWEQIQSIGLKRMERNHIHLALGLPGASGVISGMRSSCEVLIWVDLHKAEAAGVTFYRSKNGVILTEDINGVVEPQFFRSVVDRKTGAALDAK